MFVVVRAVALTASILLLSALPASAKNLLVTTFAGAQTFTAPGNLKLFKSGSFTQAFFSEQAETVMISFSSMCSTSGTTNQFTNLRILVDGSPVYPTGQLAYVFCSVGGTTGIGDGQSTATVLIGRAVSAGSHSIQAIVTPRNGGTSRITNLSLIVWN
jgi:hypothetical protein